LLFITPTEWQGFQLNTRPFLLNAMGRLWIFFNQEWKAQPRPRATKGKQDWHESMLRFWKNTLLTTLFFSLFSWLRGFVWKNHEPQISQIAQIVLKDMTHSYFEKFLLFSFLFILIC
jgi:hypothetical protein